MRSYLFNVFLKHPTNVCMGYWQHFKFSFEFSILFLSLSFKSLVHCFFPNFFITSTTDSVAIIQKKLKDAGC